MYDVTPATNVWDIQGVSASDPSIKSSSNTTVGLILQRNMYKEDNFTNSTDLGHTTISLDSTLYADDTDYL